MLHYCAGLQCCLDIEEASAAEGGVHPEALSVTVNVVDVGDSKSADAADEDGSGGENEEGTFVSSFTTTLKNTPDESVDKKSEADMETVFSMDSSDEEKETSERAVTA